jgi:hypothetical protein
MVLICNVEASFMSPPLTGPVCQCALPCGARFVIWSFRVARLSVNGSTHARERLREIGDCLNVPDMATALEQWMRIVHHDAPGGLDVREFGSPYLSETEIELLAAMMWLQQGHIEIAERVLSRYVESRNLPNALQAADFWVLRLKQAGIRLFPFQDGELPPPEPASDERVSAAGYLN